MPDNKTACRTPTKGRDGVTNIPTWKFDLLRAAILAVVREAGATGLPFSDLSKSVGARLDDDTRARLGSVGWHTTCVKLELEVRGDIQRLAGAKPQRLILG